ncbi:MAG: hypothetical protein GY869_01235, partial [Planctomycetes bacterium]|nr:hypothetical protein [Planctomycetota bacterium]
MDLSDISGLATTDGNFIVGNGASWGAESGPDARTSIGLGNVEDINITDWMESGQITTVGIISSGVWQGTPIAADKIGDLPASKITSGVFDNTRINWASPEAIGAMTPAAGKFTMLSASGPIDLDGGLTINDSGSDVDMRVKGSNDPNLFYVDAENNNVGIGVPNPANKLSVAGIVESTEEGFKFPNDTIQTTAVNVGPDGNIKQLIQNFVVASGKSVTAGDVVSFIDGTIQKGFLPSSNISHGPKYTFNSESGNISVAALSTTKFVVAYTDVDGPDNFGVAVIGDVSGNAVTYGSGYRFNEDPTSNISIAALSSIEFVVTYSNGENDGYGMSVIGKVTGNIITFDSRSTFNPAPTDDISTFALSETKFVIVYQDIGNSSYGTAIIGETPDAVSTGTTNLITYGPEYVFASNEIGFISGATLSSSEFVVVFQDVGNGGGGLATIHRVSGMSIDFIKNGAFEDDNIYLTSVAALSSSKFVVAYKPSGGQDDITAVIGETGGEGSIDYGPKYAFTSEFAESISAAALSSSRFVITWNSYEDYGGAIHGDVSGGVITFGLTDIFSSTS